MQYKFRILEGIYTICSLEKESDVPLWVNKSRFYSITKTNDELSIFCIQENIPSGVKCENNWKILQIDSVLDLSMVGVTAEISTLLAKNNINLFAVSTFNTDYICVKEHNLEKTIEVFKKAGNTIY